MAQNNVERIGKSLDLLNAGLQPYIEREMKAVCGARWLDAARESVREDRPDTGAFHWDTQAILAMMWNQWNTVFKNKLGQAERSVIGELRDVRNRWAHQKPFTTDDAYRALDSI